MFRPQDPYINLFERYNPVYPDPEVYWSVTRYDTGQKTVFRSKNRALIYQQSINVPSQVFFHFYEKPFSLVKFDQEPHQSLSELLRLRAIELRDTYKYLRLWVSGGSDSMTALHAFVSNNIFVDEIVMHIYDNDSINATRRFAKTPIIDVAIPFLHQWKNQLERTKITMYRSDLSTLAGWHVSPDVTGDVHHLDGFDLLGVQFRLPTTGAMLMIADPPGDKWCDILGGAKTRICRRNGRWYAYVVDMQLLSSMMATTTEDFFVSKHRPWLFVKTAHTLRKFFQSLDLDDAAVDRWCSIRDPNNHRLQQYNQAIGRLVLPSSSYVKTGPGGEFEPGTDDESWNTITSHQGQKIFDIYNHNRKHLVESFDYLWNKNSTGHADPKLGAPGYFSKFYCLDDGTINEADLW